MEDFRHLFGYFIVGIRSKTYVGDRHEFQPLVGGCVQEGFYKYSIYVPVRKPWSIFVLAVRVLRMGRRSTVVVGYKASQQLSCVCVVIRFSPSQRGV